MRHGILALGCCLLAGSAFAQQAASPSTHPIATAGTATVASAAPPRAVATGPAHPLTDAQAKQLLQITGAEAMKAELKNGMLGYFKMNMPFMPKDVADDLDQTFDKADLDTPIIAVYKKHISVEDADAIIAFYKTPAGKSMIEALPGILQDSRQIGMQEGRKVAQDVINRHRPELQAAAKQYQEEHAPKVAPSLNTPDKPGALGSSGTVAPNAAPAAKPNTAPAAAPGAAPSTAPATPPQ